jgi:ABC-type microcin C transport system permease subunit YejB
MFRRPKNYPKRKGYNVSALSLMTDGTSLAAILHLKEKGIDPETVDADRLRYAVRKTLADEWTNILQEWRDMIEVNAGEPFLRNAMNIQCNWLALKALRDYGFIEAKSESDPA